MELNRPKLSVIIPTYNSAKTLNATLKSVLSLPIAEMEIIVSDHSSSDETRHLVSTYKDSRLKTRIESSELSVAEHWTNASKLAGGEFFKLVCADDIVDPESVLKQIRALEMDATINMVACRRNIIDDSGKIILKNRGLNNLIGKIEGTTALKKSLLTGTNQFGEPACVMFRNSVFQNCLPWSESNPYVIDLEMYANVLSTGDFYGLAESGAFFRITSNSWSSQLARQQSSQFINLLNLLNWKMNLKLSKLELLRASFRAKILSFVRRIFELRFS